MGVVFLAMHRFGVGCCGGHDHGPGRGSDREEEPKHTKEGADRSSPRP